MFDEMITPLLTTEWGRRLAWGSLACISLLLFILLISTGFSWYSDLTIAKSNGVSVVNTSSNDEVASWITQLPRQHLFGHANETGAILPITSLQLHLLGIIETKPQTLSRAIISQGTETGKVYRLGDSVVSGVKLNAVTHDGVILDNNGCFEKLPLQRSPLLFQRMPKPLPTQENMQEE